MTNLLASPFFLTARANDPVVAAIRLSYGTTDIGRSSSSEIYLPHASISRKHAAIHVTYSEVIVEDLQSHNGTFLNGMIITQSVVVSGDLLRFGKLEFQLSRSPVSERGGLLECETEDDSSFMVTQSAPAELTKSQARVFEQMITGKTELQIAAELNLSRHTVHNHAREIYRHFEVRSRSELLLRVFRKDGKTRLQEPQF